MEWHSTEGEIKETDINLATYLEYLQRWEERQKWRVECKYVHSLISVKSVQYVCSVKNACESFIFLKAKINFQSMDLTQKQNRSGININSDHLIS